MPIERAEIPYEGSSFPALFWKANRATAGRRRRGVLQRIGQHQGTGHLDGHWRSLTARWHIRAVVLISPEPRSAALEEPSGRLRLASAGSRAVDYLESRSDVDKARIGMFGLSLGGYFAPRAAAFEKRFALCAVLGAKPQLGRIASAVVTARARTRFPITGTT